jgi:hypothetical protein
MNLALITCDLSALGRAMHVLQDSFSHEGYGPVFGHARASFFAELDLEKDPDDPMTDIDKTIDMLRKSYTFLKQFHKKCRKEAQKCCES